MYTINRVILATVLMCIVRSAMADIYVREDSGVPVFSDLPDHNGFNLFLRTNDLPRTSLAKRSDTTRSAERMRLYSPLVDSVAKQHDLEPALLHAVIMVESGYNPDARSPKGAVGLMQLMPQTAQRFGIANSNDPEQNLMGGARYLAALISRFDGNISLALAAYNAGENSVRRWGMKIPPFSETQQYVPAVLNRYRWLLRKPI